MRLKISLDRSTPLSLELHDEDEDGALKERPEDVDEHEVEKVGGEVQPTHDVGGWLELVVAEMVTRVSQIRLLAIVLIQLVMLLDCCEPLLARSRLIAAPPAAKGLELFTVQLLQRPGSAAARRCSLAS